MASLHDGLSSELGNSSKGDLRALMQDAPIPVLPSGAVDAASMADGEPARQVNATLTALNAALAAGDKEALASCFFPGQAYWKDQLALTYHLRTFSGAASIASNLLETKALRDLAGGFEIRNDATFVPATPTLQFIDGDFAFHTWSPAAAGSGRLLLLPVTGKTADKDSTPEWKIWILSTKLDGLDAYPEDEALLQAPGRPLEVESLETDVLIVGGGNGAATLAARLKTLGVDSIMVERNAAVGDNWALRYECLRFHVPTSFCEMPYMTYDKALQTPHQLSKDELAEQLRRYVAALHLNVITSARVAQTTQLPDKRWRVEVDTPAGRRTITARHLVQATGVSSQKPYLPPVENAEAYEGIRQHSAAHKSGAQLKSQGARSVVIVGSGNTAFDVLADCAAAGLQTTMVVRSPTYIVPVEYVCHKLSLGVYDYGVEAADRLILTLPSIVEAQFGRGLFAQFAAQEPDRYAALAQTGFPVYDSRDPQAVLAHHLIERGGGHYVDAGATAVLSEGRAAVKANVEPVAYTRQGLRFSDGSAVEADAVVWCTGFADADVRNTVAEVLQAPLPVDATWGIDPEGEIRGMWKRHAKVDNFWFAGGFTQQHRWHSRTLALQIKAALEGLLPPAYLGTAQ